VDGGNANHCQCGYRLHFGLGQRKIVDRVKIRWPCGYVHELTDVSVNQKLWVEESVPAEFLEEKRKMAEIAKTSGRMWESASVAGEMDVSREAVDWNEIGDFKKAYLELKTELDTDPENPEIYYRLGLLLDEAGRQKEALNHLERAVTIDPEDLDYANIYRFKIRAYGHKYFDRSMRFFEDLVQQNPRTIMARLNKALSYVDKMPYPRLGIVRQGILSNQSIAELDEILKLDPDCWAARYIRAMNHLHWPRKLDHAPLAIADFDTLIELQDSWGPEAQEDYFAYSYVALGDAYVKNRDTDFEGMMHKARETWEEGLRRFPDSPDLKERLSIIDDEEELIAFIKKLRGLEDPVDTDLSLIWIEKK
jgi:tetratricopeptide (TPR) repeat protein